MRSIFSTIDRESEETFETESAVFTAISDPSFISSTEDSMSSEMFLAASALLPARFLTSSATTAKPFPALPALAASTAALSARILVWKVISSMVLTISEISFDLLSMAFMASSRFCI